MLSPVRSHPPAWQKLATLVGVPPFLYYDLLQDKNAQVWERLLLNRFVYPVSPVKSQALQAALQTLICRECGVLLATSLREATESYSTALCIEQHRQSILEGSQTTTMTPIKCEGFLEGDVEPIPEDFAMRGLWWTKEYYPNL